MSRSSKKSGKPRLLKEFLKARKGLKLARANQGTRRIIEKFLRVPEVKAKVAGYTVDDFGSLAGFCVDADLPFLLEYVTIPGDARDTWSLDNLFLRGAKSAHVRQLEKVKKKLGDRGKPVGVVWSSGYGSSRHLVIHNFQVYDLSVDTICVRVDGENLFVHKLDEETISWLMS